MTSNTSTTQFRPKSPDNITDHIIKDTSTVADALEAINALSGSVMTLFVEDSDHRICGSVTDGDIRRGLIAGVKLSDSVKKVVHPDFKAIRREEDAFRIVKEARMKGITLLPILNNEGKINSIVDLRNVRSILPVDAVLMAGGRGERLRPLTLTVPKPLLKVGHKAIIDYNIDELKANGIDSIIVSVNYLKEQIEEHFALTPGVTCVAEPERMGTLGSLSLMRHLLRHDTLLIMNSDLLTDLNFEKMYESHINSNAALTIGAIPYNVAIPFAIMNTDGDRIVSLSEKPTYNYFANAGVYMMRRELADRVPDCGITDAPDFIEQLISEGLKVSYFPIMGTWIDIGSPDDFRYACELMSRPGPRPL